MNCASPKRRRRLQAPSCAVFAALVLLAAQCVRPQEACAAAGAASPSRYQPDPLLVEAVDYWSANRWDRRDRDRAISLFQNYIDAAPDSLFLPEIYFRVGEMYDAGQPGKPATDADHDLAMRYFQLAHEAYGDKYCFESEGAWRRLVTLTGDLPKLREYHDWLKCLDTSGTIDDIHPVRSMTRCVRGSSPTRSDDEKRDILQSSKNEISSNAAVTEESIVLVTADQTSLLHSPGASELALGELVKAYAGTHLGDLAQRELDRLRAQATGAIGYRIVPEPDLGDESSQAPPDSVDAEVSPPMTPAPAPPETPAPASQPQDPQRRTNRTALVLGAAALVLLAVFLFIRARRGARTDS